MDPVEVIDLELMRTFAKVMGRRDVDISATDKISPQDFSAVLKSVGVLVSEDVTFAVFNKYGQDIRGMMPVLVSAAFRGEG